MQKLTKWLSRLVLVLALAAGALWHWLRLPFLKTAALVLGLAAYHFFMRLTVANSVNAVMHNHADYRAKRYRVSPWEEKLYKKWGVKHWKDRLPTYDPSTFDPKKHSWDEIAQTTCQSEWVHELDVLFSFLPLLAVKWTGHLPLLLITSLVLALAESLFIILQRYNRNRIIKMLDRPLRKQRA